MYVGRAAKNSQRAMADKVSQIGVSKDGDSEGPQVEAVVYVVNNTKPENTRANLASRKV